MALARLTAPFHASEQYLAEARRRCGIGFPQRAHALVALLAGGSQAVSFFDGVFMVYRCTAFLRDASGAHSIALTTSMRPKTMLSCCKTLDGYFFRVKTCLNGAS